MVDTDHETNLRFDSLCKIQVKREGADWNVLYAYKCAFTQSNYPASTSSAICASRYIHKSFDAKKCFLLPRRKPSSISVRLDFRKNIFEKFYKASKYDKLKSV